DVAENYWGDKLCRSEYKRSPEESLDRIIKHIRKVLPKMDEKELRALLLASGDFNHSASGHFDQLSSDN
ncbi:MAG: hypothetical protein J6M92_01055, partial [Oribacterium sp.]|nr:hypothetical protein [Oribacterium sp.]